MQCAQHPETAASGYCTNCGRAICMECTTTVDSRILCSTCGSVPSQSSPRVAYSETSSTVPTFRNYAVPGIPPGYVYCSPGVSLALGFIPGVGAISNGDYLRAFLQVLVFGSLVSLSGSDEVGELSGVLGVLTAAFYFYMPFEAYHLAKKRILAMQGITVVTPLDKIKLSEFAIGCGAVLLGTVFLVGEFVPGTLRFVMHGWPLILIGIGAYNLVRYFRTPE